MVAGVHGSRSRLEQSATHLWSTMTSDTLLVQSWKEYKQGAGDRALRNQEGSYLPGTLFGLSYNGHYSALIRRLRRSDSFQSDQALQALWRCSSLPSWLAGFDPPVRLHLLFSVWTTRSDAFVLGDTQRSQTIR